MRTFIATAAAAVMLASGLGAAGANGWGPPQNNNPNHPAWFGLCTAYQNNRNGNANSGGQVDRTPPFTALRETAEEWSGEEGDDAIRAFCAQVSPGGGARGGNGGGNGGGNPGGRP